MADNVVLNSGSGGQTLATDDITGVHYQRVKLTDGTADGATEIASGNGLSANALRVTISSDSTGLVSIDDNGGSLTVDSSDLVTIAGAVTGTEMQVDVVAALPAGTNAIGKLAANTGVDIGDVDVTSIVPGTGATNLGKAEDAVHATGDVGVMGLTVRRDADTTLAGLDGDYAPMQVNATGALKVEVFDGGDSHTVDSADLVTIAGAVTGTEMQVDVVAALPAGTNAIGKLAANSGVDIGDVDVTSIAAGTNLVGDVGLSGARTSGGTTLNKNIDVDETEDQIKATAGQIYWIHAINLAASVRFLKIYNATAANVTVGTTVPDLTFPIPTQGDTNGAGFTLTVPNGIAFSTAITIAATTGIADADAGAPGANEVVVNLGFA